MMYDGQLGNAVSSNGALVVGGRQRYGSSVSVFGEESFYHGNGNNGLTHTYGVDFTPWNDLTVGGNVEVGEVGDLDRTAVSANIGYGNEDTHASVAGEYREEKELSTMFERQTYVVRANARHEMNDELTVIGRGNLSFSDNNSDIDDGEFAEGSVGLAYRPTDNDRLNVLARYTFLYDLATQPQINSGTASAYRQKSHIVSIDFNYDLSKMPTIGGKYGYKR